MVEEEFHKPILTPTITQIYANIRLIPIIYINIEYQTWRKPGKRVETENARNLIVGKEIQAPWRS